MITLLFFAFISGLVTIAAPCIWPILPIVMSSTVTGGRRKPLGITLGLMLSFAIFTLSISYIVSLFGIDADFIRLVAVVIISVLGLTLLVPKLNQILESMVARLTSRFQVVQGQQDTGFWGGFVTGIALGLIWAPCAGPILAAVATLAVTQQVNFQAVLVITSYVIGIGIPLFIFATASQRVLQRAQSINRYTKLIQQVFGGILIVTAIMIYTGYDRILQSRLLDYFPSYTNFITNLESGEAVTEDLENLTSQNNADTFKLSDEKSNETLPNLGKAPEFTNNLNWLNSDALTLNDLKGKVVLVDFWTYTCINCIRTLPHLVNWHSKYEEKGLVIIGVHAPEFEFEKKTQNVLNAMEQHNIEYIVAQDNEFRTWRAYNNRYWPAKYLIDAEGNVRYTHFGEGKYEETEQAIQDLLKEAGKTVDDSVGGVDQIRANQGITPEIYLGAQRMEYHYPNKSLSLGEQTTEFTNEPTQNRFSLIGTWNVEKEYSQSENKSKLYLNFKAKDVYLVMKSKDGIEKEVTVFIDDSLVTSENQGSDVTNGEVKVISEDVHHLISLDELEEHILRLELEEGVQIFAFTFG